MPSALAIFTCRPNSHPFQERHVYLDEPVKIGRSVARCRPAQNNATFDCKVLSRNHALVWFDHKTCKFYLQDTKSSNGTFINSQRLSRGSEESPPCEILSGDVIQFGVDVTENTRKVTHGCIVSTVKLFLPEGLEARRRTDVIQAPLPSPVDKVAANTPTMYSQELFQLSQYLQEALHREQMLEQKLATLQRLLACTQEASNTSWQALIAEDRLLSRLEVMGNQLQACSKNQTEDGIRKELVALQEDKHNYETTAKESLRRVLQEKIEVVRKLSEVERSLSNTEDECTHLKEMNERTQEELRELANKYNGAVNEMKDLSDKLKTAEGKQEEIQQKGQAEKKELQHKIDEMEEKEQELQAKIEALQADNDFTNERLTALQGKLIEEEHLTKGVEETKLLKESQAEAKESDLSDTLSPSKEKSSDDTTDALMDEQELNEPINRVTILKALLEDERKANRLQVEESTRQIHLLQAQLQRLQNEIEILREQKENDIASTRDELASAQDEIALLQRVAEQATSEHNSDIAELQGELQEVRAELEQWRKAASESEKEIVSLQASFQRQCQEQEEQQRKEAAHLQADVENLRRECKVLQADCFSLQHENASLTEELKRQKNDLLSSQKQSRELASDLNVLNTTRKELENQVGSLKEESQRDAAGLKHQLKEAESRAKDFQKEYEKTQTLLSELKVKYEMTEQEKQTIMEELKRYKDNLKLLQEKGNNRRWPWMPVITALVAVTALVLYPGFSRASP
uniref:Sarcolemmal membrane-associated protein n=1 Tax=Geotrypetes seraphini TaxID=260995 RepID=A0A6P8Q3N5_GEOSA|nr:sarcolemmal membrane-associated protein isoform X24 [Geotrypetes seraphini]